MPRKQDEAEQRASERRAKEAVERLEADAADARRAEHTARVTITSEQAAKEARQNIATARAELQGMLPPARKGLELLKAKIKAAEAAIGNAEGAIVTANDVAKQDPARGLACIQRALDAFKRSG